MPILEMEIKIYFEHSRGPFFQGKTSRDARGRPQTFLRKKEKKAKIKNKGPEENINKLSRKIKYEARKDKNIHLLEQFNENPKETHKQTTVEISKGPKTKYT